MGPDYGEKLIEWVPLVREGQTVLPKLRLEGLEAAPGAYMVPRRLLGPHVPCMPNGTSPSHSQLCNASQGQHWSGPGIKLGPGLAWGKITQEGQRLSPKLLLGLCSLVASLGPLDTGCPQPGLGCPL